jgi:hypothetical protein
MGLPRRPTCPGSTSASCRPEGSSPCEIRTQIEVMKTEVMKYQALADSINSFKERSIVRGRTHSTCLIGGSQTVQRYQDSRKWCVRADQLTQLLPA